MEIPLKAIVVLAVMVLVLVVVSIFFLQSSTTSMTSGDAQRIFAARCLAYSQQGCDWSVTYQPEFQKYVDACRILYGSEHEAFSCLYTYCQSCFETADLKCSGLCNVCSGHQSAEVDKATCCLRYSGECSGSSYKCGTCS